MLEWIGVENATMPLENLNHVLVLTRDLGATRDFYVDVLGLEDGYRPPFPFSGHWIYLGDRAVIHVAENRGYLHTRDQVRDGSADSATGSIDHVAFKATGFKAMIARLEKHGIAAHRRKVPDLDLHQVFVHDPNGVRIELNYPASEGVGVVPTGQGRAAGAASAHDRSESVSDAWSE
jgi:catechol 2,3-dioxygenase-like lactoylglutathione lyase family enzyme